MFFKAATDTEPAKCEACGNNLASTLLVGALILVALVVVALVAYSIKQRYPARVEWFSQTFSLINKVKIITFYMVVTKIDNIYEVSMPTEVRDELKRLSGWITFGLMGLSTTPLECMGLAGYKAKLIF